MPLGDRLHQLAVRGCLIAGIVLLTAGVGPCQSQEPDQPSGGAGRQERATNVDDKPPTEDQPAAASAFQDALNRITGALETIATKEESAEERHRAIRDLGAQESMATWALWMFIASGGQAILTAIGVIFIYFTLKYTKRAAEYAKEAADAAHESVVVAKDTLRVTRVSAEAQLRAYVGVDKVTSKPRPERNQVEFVAHIRNGGQTPAYNVRVRLNATVADVPVPDDAETQRHHIDMEESISVIPSNREIFIRLETGRFLDPNQIAKVAAGRSVFLIHGVIAYDHIFEEDRKTVFRYQYGKREHDRGRGEFVIASRGNEST